MKTVFIGATRRNEPDYDKVSKLVDEKIPAKKISICYSNQYGEIAKKLSEKLNKEVLSKVQVLGCSSPRFPKETKAVLIIGEAKFHPVSIAYESALPTYVLEGESFKQITDDEIERYTKKEKGMYLKYLNSKNVGVIVTNKPGQERMKFALAYNKKLREKDEKKGYLFISNDIDVNEFENFGIDVWVNTACPRMDLTDGSIINLDKLMKLEKSNSSN